LVLSGMLLALFILEIAFRIRYPDPAPKLVNQALQRHDTYGIAFTPHAEGWNTSLRGEYSTYVKINGKGLRGKEYRYTKESDTFRILVLGDSFTAALQVDEGETFPALLAAQLNRRYDIPHFEVINAGVVGYGTTNELDYFKHEGYKYQPDLVLLAFFSGNDISDNLNPPHYKLENGRLTPIPAVYAPDFGTPPWAREGTLFRNARNFLYTHSRLYSVTVELLLYALIRQSPQLTQRLAALGFVEATRPVLNTGNIYASLQPSPAAWDMTEALILALNQAVAERGGQLVVAILPDETEVDPDKWADLLQAYPALFDPGAMATAPTARLGQFLGAAGIPYLPLGPALRAYQAETGESLYFPIDGHWKPVGHRVAAQAIYDYLIQHADQFEGFPR
jgi:hypothetical protein